MDARLDAKQREDQRIVDAANDKRVGDMADTLNTSIKKGILDAGDGKSVGEALRENIIDSVQNMTVDIILNPVTTVFSRMLAQLADQFSLMLTKSLYESIASESKDPIGMLFTLFGWGMSGNTGGTAISGPGLQVPPGFGFPQADGLAYVPYDDYPARLHRGERVLTANENARYAQGSVNINSNPVITIDSRTDQAVVYGIVVDAVQRGNQALVEEMRSQGVIG